MLAVGLIGAFAAFKIRVFADHVRPIIALPLAQFSLVANNLFGTQTVTMNAETRKAYKRAFMMSLHDNGKAQGKK